MTSYYMIRFCYFVGSDYYSPDSGVISGISDFNAGDGFSSCFSSSFPSSACLSSD